VLELHQQAVDTLDRLLQAVEAFKEPDANVVLRMFKLRLARNVAARWNSAVPRAVDEWVAGRVPDTEEKVDLSVYFTGDQPNNARLGAPRRSLG
jgi:hypothetical protein